ncbi:MAG: hypothetical protein IJU88_06600 [Ruminococcus sp.]|nr:hypothetical protein [Ruminococcus sp.]MBQ9542005.1 hypothetical protein [Ruminococcus sp.]
MLANSAGTAVSEFGSSSFSSPVAPASRWSGRVSTPCGSFTVLRASQSLKGPFPEYRELEPISVTDAGISMLSRPDLSKQV